MKKRAQDDGGIGGKKEETKFGAESERERNGRRGKLS